jgi:multiple sugar transport system substrate-binding protein
MVVTRRTMLRLIGSGLGLGLLSACAPAATGPAPTKPTEAPKPTAAPAKPAEAAKPAAPQPTEAAKPAAQAPAQAASGPLTFWLYKTRLDPLDSWRTERIQAWSKQANVAVEIIEIATSDYNKKVPAAIESKTLPDVMEASDNWGRLLQPRELLADLTEVFQRIDREQKWTPGMKALSVWPDGKAYQIPIASSGHVVITRDDALREAGLEFPKTWAEFFEVAAKAQRPPRTYGVGVPLSNTSDTNNWIPSLLTYGARFADEQGKKATFGNYKTEVVEWLNMMLDAYDTKKVFPPGVLTWDQTGDNDAYQSGRTIFAFNPLSIPVWLRENKPDLLQNTGTYLYPRGPKLHVSHIGGVAMTVRADSKLRDKASELIYFLYDLDYMREFFRRAQYGPATEAQFEFPAFTEQFPVRVELARNGQPAAWPDVDNEAYAEMLTSFVVPRMLQRVVSDRAKPEQAFEEAAEAVQQIYQKYEKA